MIKRHRLLLLLVAFSLSLLLTHLFSRETKGAQASTTPETVVDDELTGWTLDAGMLYWADFCPGIEFHEPAHLRRQPAHGGTRVTLATEPVEKCKTYFNLVSDEDGVYYYNRDTGEIEFRPVADPFDPPTRLVAADVRPGVPLVVDEDHVYWVTPPDDSLIPGSDIRRIDKDGSGEEVVGSAFGPVSDLIVLHTGTVYWLDDGGLVKSSVNCGTLPCETERVSDRSGDHLLFVSHIISSSLYWVQDSSPERIVVRTCGFGGCSVSTLYTAPTDHEWQLGDLVAGDGNIFWPERYRESGGVSDGRLRRRDGDGNVEDIVANVPAIMYTAHGDDRYVYFADRSASNEGIYRLPFDAEAISYDLAFADWEVVQAIQRPANDVPLVADKTTHVRVYGQNLGGSDVVAAGVQLRGSRDGEPLPGSPLSPVNGPHPLRVGAGYDRGKAADSWIFRLPASWTHYGNTSLTFELDPAGAYADPDRSNNVATGTFTFAPRRNVCLVFVPVRTHAPAASTDNVNFWPMIGRLKQMWPVQNLFLSERSNNIQELTLFRGRTPFELPGDGGKVLTRLAMRKAFTRDPEPCRITGRTIWVGMVHDQTKMSVTGMARTGRHASWIQMPAESAHPGTDWRKPRRASTLAQELGHNFNRNHVDCPAGGPDDPDDGYPYPDCQLDNTGASAHYGFNGPGLAPIEPDQGADFMSYAPSRWVSDYTWEALYGKLDGSGRRGTLSESGEPLAEAEEAVIISGVVDQSGNSGELGAAYAYPTALAPEGLLRRWQEERGPAAAAAAAQGDYHLRLKDGDGEILADHPVALIPVSHHSEGTPEGFTLTFSDPAASVARLELLDGDTVLHTRAPGPQTPTLAIETPAGGETFADSLTIAWQAGDADGDALNYTVLYSPDDGASWIGLATDYAVPDDGNATLSLPGLRGLPASDGQGRIRILASDGYHTAVATSEPFTVVDGPPRPAIAQPAPGAILPPGQPLALAGGALDTETGSLEGDALQWAVDGTAAGSGAETQVAGLAPGSHEVQLTATDGAGQSGTAATTVQIAPLDLPEETILDLTLDGFCDDEGYLEATAVGLAPYDDNSRANVHLVRTTDFLWACFSGMTPVGGDPASFAGLRIDVDHSRDALAQADDYGFFVGEDGVPFTRAGDGSGAFDASGPGGLSARVGTQGSIWRAELRVDADLLGGWNHLIGLQAGHYQVNGNDYLWPFRSTPVAPDSWARTALDRLPQITALSPMSTTAGSDAFTLVVEGEHFNATDSADPTVLWNGTARPTTFADGTLRAEIAAANVATAGVAKVTVQNPGAEGYESSAASFTVHNPQPQITDLSPDSVPLDEDGFELTVTGEQFVEGASVLWNGEPVATSFGSSSQLQATIPAEAIAFEGPAGIVIVNPEPGGGASNVREVTVTAPEAHRLFLPALRR